MIKIISTRKGMTNKTSMHKLLKRFSGLFLVLLSIVAQGQQDPQYTQYMYNTMSVNSAYAGSRGHLTISGLHRSQWVGFDGAPRTQTLSVDTPLGKNVGLGLSVVNDEIGPSEEFFSDLNFSYTIKVFNEHRLSFGLKGGIRLFSLDWTKGISKTQDATLTNNIRNRFFPSLGGGIYLHGRKNYIGISVPNFLTTEHYEVSQASIAAERIHLFLVAGLIFDLNDNTKFKPAVLVKHVNGAPLIFDVSANFMLYDKFRLGVAYRWDDSISGLIGFQITPGLLINYAYDFSTTELQQFNSGSHELMIRFELIGQEKKLKSPRFF